MPSTKLVPYTPEQMFDLVADVGKYQDFLPWCAGSRVRSVTPTELVADLTIGFGPFRESFTSRVALDRPKTARVQYENGPFRYLNNQWTFTPAPTGCRWISSSISSSAAGCCRPPSRGVQPGCDGDGRGIPQAGAVSLWPPQGDRRGHASPGQDLMVYAPPPAIHGAAVRVNLYSDTQTKPSAAMKAAMMEAETGDEQTGSDPTINELCARMAALLGKQAAMFLPSGTMCNEVAILTHCRPGDEILAHETAHIISSEGGAPGALAGAQVTGLKGEGGQFSPDSLRAALRQPSRYSPPQTLLEVEQTANLGGGTIWPLDG